MGVESEYWRDARAPRAGHPPATSGILVRDHIDVELDLLVRTRLTPGGRSAATAASTPRCRPVTSRGMVEMDDIRSTAAASPLTVRVWGSALTSVTRYPGGIAGEHGHHGQRGVCQLPGHIDGTWTRCGMISTPGTGAPVSSTASRSTSWSTFRPLASMATWAITDCTAATRELAPRRSPWPGVTTGAPSSSPSGTVPRSTETVMGRDTTWSTRTFTDRGAKSMTWTRGSSGVTRTATGTGRPSVVGVTSPRSMDARKEPLVSCEAASMGRPVADLGDRARQVEHGSPSRWVEHLDGHRAGPCPLVLGQADPGIQHGRQPDGRQLERPVAQQEIQEAPHPASSNDPEAPGSRSPSAMSPPGAVAAMEAPAGAGPAIDGTGSSRPAGSPGPRPGCGACGGPSDACHGRTGRPARRSSGGPPGATGGSEQRHERGPKSLLVQVARHPATLDQADRPVSSLTTITTASVCSVMPRAARCRVPYRSAAPGDLGQRQHGARRQRRDRPG